MTANIDFQNKNTKVPKKMIKIRFICGSELMGWFQMEQKRFNKFLRMYLIMKLIPALIR